MTWILSLADIGWKDAPASVAQLLGTGKVVSGAALAMALLWFGCRGAG